jgi:catechol 2,3-dioxygenase-like lactoylglutathione lyase family enzyme
MRKVLTGILSSLFCFLLPAMAQGAAIEYVQLAAPAPLQAVDWYTGFMDCEPVAGREEAVNCHGLTLEFVGRPILGGSQGTGIDHLAFSYPDVAAKMTELERVGVGGLGVRLQRFEDGSTWRDIDGFFRAAYLFDPWGTRIELVEDTAHEGFHHVHMSAAVPAATLAWYRELSGGEVGDVTADLSGLRYNNGWLLVSVHDSAMPAATEGRAIDHLAFASTALDEQLQEMAARDIVIVQPPEVPASANSDSRRAFIAGPDGVRIALVEPGWAGIALAQDNGDALSSLNDTFITPQTPWGEPDLQGVWSGDAAHGIPLERPEDVDASTALSQAEAAARRERGTLQSIWGYEREWRDTTLGYAKNAPLTQVAMVIDPPDGRLPPLTAAAEAARAAGRGGPVVPAGPEDLNSWVRCITQGLPNHMLPTVYNNGLQIVQGPGTVAITKEMIHETRIINIDAVLTDDGIHQWLGNSRGWWEDEALVIETRGFNGRAPFQGSSADMVLTERFIRIAPNLLEYRFTVDDSAVWTQPWTAMFPFVLDNDQYELVEYACHEGNYAMSNILSSARENERGED